MILFIPLVLLRTLDAGEIEVRKTHSHKKLCGVRL